jgi:hypothetical protein
MTSEGYNALAKSIVVDVGGTLGLEGSIIANIDEGIDQGNLNIKAGSLETKDLHDFYTEDERGFGFNLIAGKIGNPSEDSTYPSGSTTVSMTNKGRRIEGITKATIIVGSEEQTELSGLNRDVNNSQEITKDLITGALDYYINGILNTEKDAIDISKDKDAIVRYNSSYGFFGDLFESGMGKE